MIGWIILAVLLLLVLLAFVVRLGVLVGYDDSGFRVKVRVGPQYIQTFPVARTPKKEAKKKEKQEKKAEKKKAKKEKKKDAGPEGRDIGGLLDMALELLPVLVDAASRFLRKLQIDDLTIDVTWAEEDPADTGTHYGQGWAVMENILSYLEANFIIKHRHAALYVDFLAEKPRIVIRAVLSLTVAQLIGIGLWAGRRALKVLWDHRNTIKPAGTKAGASKKKGESNHGKQSSC